MLCISAVEYDPQVSKGKTPLSVTFIIKTQHVFVFNMYDYYGIKNVFSNFFSNKLFIWRIASKKLNDGRNLCLEIARQRCCRGACQFSKRLEKSNLEYCGFEASRYLTVRRPSAYQIEARNKIQLNLTHVYFRLYIVDWSGAARTRNKLTISYRIGIVRAAL